MPADDRIDLVLPRELRPADGRFGCGPSRIRPEQLASLTGRRASVLGTSHRQAPVRALVGEVRRGLATLFDVPDGYEVVLGDGGSTAFWDVAAFSLVERRSQNLAFGEFGAKFAAACGAPWLEAPDVRRADSGTRSVPEPVEGVDVYAWPHNETSTGVMAPVERVGADPGALTVVDATSAAGGVAVDVSAADVYYFAPQKNFGSDGGLWFALLSPAALERVDRIAASGRHIPAFLSLADAVGNSRLDQTLNTPALVTLALMADQIEWMHGLGGLDAVDARTRRSSSHLYSWAESHELATPFVRDPADRSQVVVTIDLDGVDAAALASALRANGIVDTEPYRKLGRNQLRIATFASIEPDDVRRLTLCLDELIDRLS